jgi:hypothetical protein
MEDGPVAGALREAGLVPGRAHGGAPPVGFQFPRSVPPGSPVIRTANQACQKLMPGGPP